MKNESKVRWEKSGWSTLEFRVRAKCTHIASHLFIERFIGALIHRRLRIQQLPRYFLQQEFCFERRFNNFKL